MAYCNKCNVELEPERDSCPYCGTPVDTTTEQVSTAQATTETNNTADKIRSVFNTANTTDEFDPADIQANKIIAILSYIGILVLVPILAANGSKFAKFHANQGLILLIIEFISGILTSMSMLFIQPIGFFAFLLWLLAFSLSIIGIVNAASGNATELPLIGSSIKLLK